MNIFDLLQLPVRVGSPAMPMSLLAQRLGARGAFRGGVKARSMAMIVPGNEDALNKIQNAKDGKKILYFTASWCPPCKMIAPKFETLAKKHSSTAFVKIDIDEFPGASEKFAISSVPTFCFMNGTSLISKFSGASEAELIENINALEIS